MYQREKRPVKVISFAPEVNAYGQKRTVETGYKMVDMMITIYSQTPTSDVRYNNVDLIGLTEDDTITDANQIEIDGAKYNIINIVRTGRLNRILLEKQ